MTGPSFVALTSVALALLLAIALLITKWLNNWRRRFEAVRRASYVAVFGELTARGSYPQDILASWTDDPVFRSALVDFIRLLDGIERDRLLRVARDLGIVDSAVVTLRKSRRRRARIRAALMLAELADPKTARALAAALSDPESGVRINASAALAKIGEPDAIGAILGSVDHESEWDAARAMDHLASLGTAAVDGLLEYLGDLSEQMPRYGPLALRTLGQIGDLRAEPTLLHALASTETETRLVAAGALQACGTTQCVEPLISAMADPDGRVRARAAKSLGAHFDDRAIEPLMQGLRDREWWVRKNSAGALAQLPGGVPALQLALRDNDPFARDAAREQLMILGVPAGASEGETAGPSEHWVEDQLRALETGESSPDESPDWIQDQMNVLHTRVQTLDTPGFDHAAQPAESLRESSEPEPAEGRPDAELEPVSGAGATEEAVDWIREQMQSLAALDDVPTDEDEDEMNTDRSAGRRVVGETHTRDHDSARPEHESKAAADSHGPAHPATPGEAEPAEGVEAGLEPSASPVPEGTRRPALSALDEALESHGLSDPPLPEQRAS